MPAGMPTAAPAAAPIPVEPAAQPTSAPIPVVTPAAAARTAPAPAGSKLWRSIGASIPSPAQLVTVEMRLFLRNTTDFVLPSRSRRQPLPDLLLAPPQIRVAEFHDLQVVDDVDGDGERESADDRDDHRRPEVPFAVLAERNETGRERRPGEHQAPRPHGHGRASLRDPTAEEAVVEVRLVGQVDLL